MEKLNKQKQQYDVIILGNSLSACVLGTILASRSLSVILVGNKYHPNFTIGESTIPQTSLIFKVLSEKYAIPEFMNISSFESVAREVSPFSGKKRNFGFVFHENSHDYTKGNFFQLGALQDNVKGDKRAPKVETHLYRQEVDYYLYRVALSYGCDSLVYSNYQGVQITADGVSLQVDDIELKADFIVDGSGFSSPFVKQIALRDSPEVLKTNSRSIFTHMINVKAFENCIEDTYSSKPAQWSEGTLHHLFKGGWLWVIPFTPTQPLRTAVSSVGLMLDCNDYPLKNSITPEQEFYEFVSSTPSLLEQFSKSVAVQRWVRSGRIQYVSKKCSGERFCLLSHSYGFIDPLFSRGLSNTLETIFAAADLIVNSFSGSRFCQVDFSYLETLQHNLVKYNDLLVSNAYLSFSSLGLWNAWFRIWGLAQPLGIARISTAYQCYLQEGKKKYLDDLLNSAVPGSLAPNDSNYNKLFLDACEIMDKYRESIYTSKEATDRLFTLLSEASFLPPHFRYNDRSITIGSETNSDRRKRSAWLESEISHSIL